MLDHALSFFFLFRLQLEVQLHLEEEDRGQKTVETWSEVVVDLWEKHLPHLREELHGEGVPYNPKTGSCGFPEVEGEDDGANSLEAAFLKERVERRDSLTNSRSQPASTVAATTQDVPRDLNWTTNDKGEEVEERVEGREGEKKEVVKDSASEVPDRC